MSTDLTIKYANLVSRLMRHTIEDEVEWKPVASTGSHEVELGGYTTSHGGWDFTLSPNVLWPTSTLNVNPSGQGLHRYRLIARHGPNGAPVVFPPLRAVDDLADLVIRDLRMLDELANALQ